MWWGTKYCVAGNEYKSKNMWCGTESGAKQNRNKHAMRSLERCFYIFWRMELESRKHRSSFQAEKLIRPCGIQCKKVEHFSSFFLTFIRLGVYSRVPNKRAGTAINFLKIVHNTLLFQPPRLLKAYNLVIKASPNFKPLSIKRICDFEAMLLLIFTTHQPRYNHTKCQLSTQRKSNSLQVIMRRNYNFLRNIQVAITMKATRCQVQVVLYKNLAVIG